MAAVANEMRWTEARLPGEVARMCAPSTRLFVGPGKIPLKVLVSREPVNGWHLSISHPWRNPTWDEIKSARYTLVPDAVRMTMDLPPSSEFVNVHEFCFHLYECQCAARGAPDPDGATRG